MTYGQKTVHERVFEPVEDHVRVCDAFVSPVSAVPFNDHWYVTPEDGEHVYVYALPVQAAPAIPVAGEVRVIVGLGAA